MKKILMAVLFAGCSFAVFAQSGGFVSSESAPVQGGFSGPGMVSEVTSVAQAKMRRDDAKVVLEGNIVRQVGNELYEFRDNSGSIYVDIDASYWQGQNISPNDKVRIEGDVDKDWNSVEIDAKRITLLK
ncbi:YgiW/YdeI family stress tolerance OB fold protein [Escherichia sp. E3659]|uniref:YgiW/YdeI family stress tolerance OB fold protein n=1 Tax=Escherichia TaxID=561 RepID=UPI0002A43BC3|nr:MULTISPECIES: YgiW/YdeI family stress tolerance OB fold protein [Escherichia]ELG93114.1 TIGR00156 family protein [Escherichia coli KTE146]TLJ10745.1 YgiW/YdeI family stress tolerance OB fold protein [Escherichia sp. E3659]